MKEKFSIFFLGVIIEFFILDNQGHPAVTLVISRCFKKNQKTISSEIKEVNMKIFFQTKFSFLKHFNPQEV